MPAIDLTDPRILTFYAENFEKEARSRLNWIELHKETLEKAASLKGEPKNYTVSDSSAHRMKKGMSSLKQDYKDSSIYRITKNCIDAQPSTAFKLGHSIVDLGIGDPKDDPRLAPPDNDPSPDPIMRPVDSTTAEIIYKPRPEFGRVTYLDKRMKKLPEDRYYFPECLSWVYGWRLKDCKVQKPIFGRYWHLTRTLRNRSGAQPDPAHYGPARNIKVATQCDDLS